MLNREIRQYIITGVTVQQVQKNVMPANIYILSLFGRKVFATD